MAPWGAVGWQGWGLVRLYPGIAYPFMGHNPARGWPSGRLGQDGPQRCLQPGPVAPSSLSTPQAFLGQPGAPTCAVLTSPGPAPSHLPQALSCRPPAPGGSCPFPKPHALSHPSLLRPLFSHLLQTMAAALVLALALLALQPGLKSNEVADVETTERMQQREAYLNEQMTRLLQEVERSRSTEETTLLSGLEQWWFWTIPAALVLFAVVCWLERGAIFPSACCSEQASSGSKQEKGKEEEEFTGLPNGVRSLSTPTPPPRQGLPNKCKLLKELVDDLLSVCRVLSERNFMPQLFPGTGMDDPCEAWSLEEKGIAYHLLVFLRPPPGHSFGLDLDTTKQLPGRPSNIHVALQCTCWKKQLLGGCACFLHHHDNKVPRARRSFLLENLCTSSYLDVEKVARWAQLLVTSAWQFLPESHHCQLTVLPSSKSCKFQLTSIAEINIVTEMFFAVEQENRDAYLRTTSDLGATD